MSIRQLIVSYLHRFYSSIVFSKCGKYASKLISCLLILSTLLSVFTFSTYAVDYDTGTKLLIDNFDVVMTNSSNPNNIKDFSSTIVKKPYKFSSGISGILFSNSDSFFYTKGYNKVTSLTNNFSVKKSHNYTVNFSTLLGMNDVYTIRSYIYVYDANNNAINTIVLYDGVFQGSHIEQKHTFDFNLSSADLPSGYKLRLGVDFSTDVKNDYNYNFALSDISILDNDDNSGLLNKIITAISIVWQSIKDGFDSMTSGFSNMISSMSNLFTNLGNTISTKFNNMTTSLSNWFTNLGNTISTKFSNITTSLSNWFAEQARKIQDFNTSVGNWFADLGNRISGFFVKLYNDIIDGLKRLFIPSDDYFTTIKSNADTFCTDHFGVIYTAPKIMIDIIRLLLNINVQAPSITMPAIDFNFMGKLIHLNDPVTLNFNDFIGPVGVLHFFYSFYRVFVTVLFIFFFIRFCIGKYNVIFGGKGSVED